MLTTFGRMQACRFVGLRQIDTASTLADARLSEATSQCASAPWVPASDAMVGYLMRRLINELSKQAAESVWEHT